MTLLVLGLIVFLGVHSVRIFADDWRGAQVARWGAARWRAVHSLFALAGLALIVVGFAAARSTPVYVYTPPLWARHLASLFTLIAFVLAAASIVPRNRIRTVVGHPLVAGVKTWAVAHLLANGKLADIVLFGAFLVWAVLDFRAARARSRSACDARVPGSVTGDAATLVLGVVLWAVFAFSLHVWLIGIAPFARP